MNRAAFIFRNFKVLLSKCLCFQCIVLIACENNVNKISIDSNLPRQFSWENLWPRGTIPCVLDPGFALSYHEISLLLRTMQLIESLTCIRFQWFESVEKLRDIQTGIGDQAVIEKPKYLWITAGTICTALVGRHKEISAHPLKLARWCFVRSALLHELLHVIGFGHEHVRVDRDLYVGVNWENVHPNWRSSFRRNEAGDGYSLLNYTIPYDTSSILHFSPFSFALDARRPTLFSLFPEKLPLLTRQDLSSLDVIKINKLYQCTDRLESFSKICYDHSAECSLRIHERDCTESEYLRSICRKTCGQCDKNEAFN